MIFIFIKLVNHTYVFLNSVYVLKQCKWKYMQILKKSTFKYNYQNIDNI